MVCVEKSTGEDSRLEKSVKSGVKTRPHRRSKSRPEEWVEGGLTGSVDEHDIDRQAGTLSGVFSGPPQAVWKRGSGT